MRRCTLEESNIHAKRVEGLRQRVCLPLQESDPGALLTLLRSLFENRADILQIKINRYLAEVTESVASFLISCFQKRTEFAVSVVGDTVLPQDFQLKSEGGTMRELTGHDERVFSVEKQALEPELLRTVEQCCSDPDSVFTAERLICVPVHHPVSEKVLFYVVLVDPQKRVDYKRKCCGLVNECMRYCLGCLLNSICYEDERREHDRARHVLELIVSMLQNIGWTEGMMDEVRLRVSEAMGAERCSIFLRDENGDFVTKLWDPSGQRMSSPARNIKLPSNFGLVGVAAETRGVVLCNDALSDSRYCVDLDLKQGTSTRNAVAFALVSGKDAVAVVEVYNKTPTKTGSVFSHEDVETARAMSLLLAPALMHSLGYSKTRGDVARMLTTDSLYLFRNKVTDAEVDQVVNCDLNHDWTPHLDLNSTSLLEVFEDGHVVCLILSVFNNLGLMRRFDVRPTVFIRFVATLRRNQPSLPYRNWGLALRCFLFASTLVNQLDLVTDRVATDVEVMALLVSVLSFTADYRGPVDRIQPTGTTTPLVNLYSSRGHILQEWQSSQVLRLLQQPETNVLEKMSPHRFSLFSRLLYKLINVADMGYWSECLSATEAWWSGADPSQRLSSGGAGQQHVLPLLMASSVLADYSKDLDHCKRVAELSYAEMIGEVGQSGGGGADAGATRTHLDNLQTHFMSTLCLPTFRMLKEMFPVSHCCWERCSINVSVWHKYRDATEQKDPPQ